MTRKGTNKKRKRTTAPKPRKRGGHDREVLHSAQSDEDNGDQDYALPVESDSDSENEQMCSVCGEPAGDDAFVDNKNVFTCAACEANAVRGGADETAASSTEVSCTRCPAKMPLAASITHDGLYVCQECEAKIDRSSSAEPMDETGEMDETELEELRREAFAFIDGNTTADGEHQVPCAFCFRIIPTKDGHSVLSVIGSGKSRLHCSECATKINQSTDNAALHREATENARRFASLCQTNSSSSSSAEASGPVAIAVTNETQPARTPDLAASNRLVDPSVGLAREPSMNYRRALALAKSGRATMADIQGPFYFASVDPWKDLVLFEIPWKKDGGYNTWIATRAAVMVAEKYGELPPGFVLQGPFTKQAYPKMTNRVGNFAGARTDEQNAKSAAKSQVGFGPGYKDSSGKWHNYLWRRDLEGCTYSADMISSCTWSGGASKDGHDLHVVEFRKWTIDVSDWLMYENATNTKLVAFGKGQLLMARLEDAVLTSIKNDAVLNDDQLDEDDPQAALKRVISRMIIRRDYVKGAKKKKFPDSDKPLTDEEETRLPSLVKSLITRKMVVDECRDRGHLKEGTIGYTKESDTMFGHQVEYYKVVASAPVCILLHSDKNDGAKNSEIGVSAASDDDGVELTDTQKAAEAAAMASVAVQVKKPLKEGEDFKYNDMVIYDTKGNVVSDTRPLRSGDIASYSMVFRYRVFDGKAVRRVEPSLRILHGMWWKDVGTESGMPSKTYDVRSCVLSFSSGAKIEPSTYARNEFEEAQVEKNRMESIMGAFDRCAAKKAKREAENARNAVVTPASSSSSNSNGAASN